MKDISQDPFMTQPWPWNVHLEFRRVEGSPEAKKIIEDIIRGKMSNLVLESSKVLDLTEGVPVNGYEFVESEFAGEWRWGVRYELIIKDDSGNFWGTTYEIQSGDNYHNSLEDGPVHFYPLNAVEVEEVNTYYFRNEDDS